MARRRRAGDDRAARQAERVEDEGGIGPADGIRSRTVAIGDE